MVDPRIVALDRRHAEERAAVEREIAAERRDEYQRLRNQGDVEHMLVPVPKFTSRQIEVLRLAATGPSDAVFLQRKRELFGECLESVEPPEWSELRDFIDDDWVNRAFKLNLLGEAVFAHLEENRELPE